LHFDQVATGGPVTLTTSATGQPIPSGFSLGNPPVYYEISTAAGYSGPIEICIPYDPARFASENGLVLYHYENGMWTNITVSHDSSNNTICGRVNSLSPFIVAGPLPAEAPEPGSLALLVSGVIGLGGFAAIRRRVGRK
jgi:hypothetical protein